MSRSSFFSNISSNEFITNAPCNEKNQPPSNISATSSGQSLEHEATKNNDIKKNKRVAYTIKIDPAVRKDIREWALKNDVTISSVIETLARSHLKDLKKEDITF